MGCAPRAHRWQINARGFAGVMYSMILLTHSVSRLFMQFPRGDFSWALWPAGGRARGRACLSACLPPKCVFDARGSRALFADLFVAYAVLSQNDIDLTFVIS